MPLTKSQAAEIGKLEKIAHNLAAPDGPLGVGDDDTVGARSAFRQIVRDLERLRGRINGMPQRP